MSFRISKILIVGLLLVSFQAAAEPLRRPAPELPVDTIFSGSFQTGFAYLNGNTNGPAMESSVSFVIEEDKWRQNIDLFGLITNENVPVMGNENARFLEGDYHFYYFWLPWLANYVAGSVAQQTFLGQNFSADGEAGFEFYAISDDLQDLYADVSFLHTYEDQGQFGSLQIDTVSVSVNWNINLAPNFSFNQFVQGMVDVSGDTDHGIVFLSQFEYDFNDNFAAVLGYNGFFDQKPVPGFKHFDGIMTAGIQIDF